MGWGQGCGQGWGRVPIDSRRNRAHPALPWGRLGVLLPQPLLLSRAWWGPVSCAVLLPPGPRAAPPELREKTLVLAKPDAVQRRLVGSIIQRFERRGFKLVAMKLLQVDRGLVDRHYQELRHKPFYPALVAYMTSGPVVAMVWEGYNVVSCTRAMVGDTDSVGTIRGDLSVHISRNVVHASDSVETAEREIGFWFQRDELVDWESKERDHTYRP